MNCSMAIAEGLAFLLVFQYIEYRGMPAVAYQRNGQASTWSNAAVKSYCLPVPVIDNASDRTIVLIHKEVFCCLLIYVVKYTLNVLMNLSFWKFANYSTVLPAGKKTELNIDALFHNCLLSIVAREQVILFNG